LNSLAGRVAVKYRDVFHTTQAAAKIVPALRVVAEKAPLCVARALIDAFSALNRGGDER
tara:strand:+ start:1504 stop:1680 length:177 start_codon:yes stop_codon:yes gene_type:complete